MNKLLRPMFWPHWRWRIKRWRTRMMDWLPGGAGRRSLWVALMTLVLAVLITLVWLAGRYEASQVQAELERDTADAVNELRTQLSRHVQAIQGVQAAQPNAAQWQQEMLSLLREHRDWLRVEWRDKAQNLRNQADSPLRSPVFERNPRSDMLNETLQSCLRARRLSGPAYSSTYFLPQVDGLGFACPTSTVEN